uniref:Uncharacterized protein n=1 Tax=Rhizophora mucronata TaxID=61149 RepID=A0A2P2LWZ3_RHIMU
MQVSTGIMMWVSEMNLQSRRQEGPARLQLLTFSESNSNSSKTIDSYTN